MSRITRSARGVTVDFELLAIKSQLAAKPVPRSVDERRLAIEEKEGGRSTSAPPPAVAELLKAAEATTKKTAPKRK